MVGCDAVTLVVEGLVNRLQREDFRTLKHQEELLPFGVVSLLAGTHWQLEPLRLSSG